MHNMECPCTTGFSIPKSLNLRFNLLVDFTLALHLICFVKVVYGCTSGPSPTPCVGPQTLADRPSSIGFSSCLQGQELYRSFFSARHILDYWDWVVIFALHLNQHQSSTQRVQPPNCLMLGTSSTGFANDFPKLIVILHVHLYFFTFLNSYLIFFNLHLLKYSLFSLFPPIPISPELIWIKIKDCVIKMCIFIMMYIF